MSAAVVRLPVLDAEGPARPVTRGDCADGPRPCPWASCTHHAIHGLLIRDGGDAITDDAAAELIETMPASCTLDVADAGGDTLAVVGDLLGVTRERVRQLEAHALQRLPRRVDHLRGALDEEPETILRPARGGAAVPVEDRRRAEPPAQHAHLPGPEGVTEAAQAFWCPWVGAVLTGTLCAKRHAARRQMNAYRGVGGGPAYPACARCEEGAALTARVGTAGELVPLRVAVPARKLEAIRARQIDWMGDGTEAEPANDITEEDDVKASRKETPSAASAKTTSSTTARCAIAGCAEARAGVRSDTKPELASYCAHHRSSVRKGTKSADGDGVLAVRRIEAVLREGVDPTNAWAVRKLYEREGLMPGGAKPSRESSDDSSAALIAEQRAQIADLSRLLSESAEREATLRADRDALLRDRPVATAQATPLARLAQLAAVLVSGDERIAWTIGSTNAGDGRWCASALGHDDAGVSSWEAVADAPDEALAALVAHVEGEARSRVEALRAALEGRS